MPPTADLDLVWRRVVNCPPEEIEEWHTTPESAAVGTRRPGDRWSVGQLAGLRTVELLETPREHWTPADWAHVRRVAGFVRRHRAQWPRGDVRRSRWRHSLRNWGHDPLWESRLDLAPADADGRAGLVVDGGEVGTVLLDEGADGGVLVERVDLAEPWQGRGLGCALLHRLAEEHGGRVELVTTGVPAGLVERLRRLHVVAPVPGANVLHLTGW